MTLLFIIAAKHWRSSLGESHSTQICGVNAYKTRVFRYLWGLFCSRLFFWNWLEQIDLTLHVICRFLGILKVCIHPMGGFLTEASKFTVQLLWSASVIHRSRGVLPEGSLQVPLFLFSMHR